MTAPRTAVRIAILAVVYCLAAQAGISLGFTHEVAPVWPPRGIGLAALLLFGVELWPGVLIGSVGISLIHGLSVPLSLAEAAGPTLAALLPAVVLRRGGFRPQLDRTVDVIQFAVYCGIVSPLITATLGTGIEWAWLGLERSAVPGFWSIWFLGDMGGALLVAPVVLAWLSTPSDEPPGQLPEALVIAVLLVTGCILGFAVSEPLLLPVFPIALWAAIRFGPRGAGSSSLLILIAVIAAAWLRRGPFAPGAPVSGIFLFQSFSLTLVITSLLLAAGAVERRRSATEVLLAQDRYRALTEVSSIATTVLDPQDRVVAWSRAAERLFGWSESEVLGRPLPNIPPGDTSETAGPRERRLGSGVLEGQELVRMRKDGSRIDVVASFWPLRSADGQVYGTMGVYRDVTAGKESERVQRALYRISEAAHTAPSLQALFHDLHAIVGDLMPARNFYIALHDPQTDTLSFPYFVDEKDPPPAARRLGKGLTEYVLRSGQALLDRPGVLEELVRRGEVQSIGAPSSDWLGVPLKTGGRTIGVLTAQSYDEGVRYTERDRDILQFVSTQVAMAIDRKRAEEAVRASEGELRAVFAAMRDVILVLDSDGRYQKIAPTNPALLYLPADELLGRTLHEIFPRDQADRLLTLLRQALRSGSVVHAEYALPIRSQMVWFAATVSPMTEDSVVWVARDITEQKKAIEALAESERRYRVLYNRSPVMAHSLDQEGRIIAVSDTWLATLGYERDEVLGRDSTEFLTSDSARYARDVVRPAFLRDGACTDVEYQMLKRDGGVIDVVLSAISERDAEGKVVRSLANLTDVTERKRMARELQQSQERFERFVQTTNDVLWDWDLSSQVIWWAPTLVNLLGFHPDQFQGDAWTRLLHPEDRDRVWNNLRAAIDGPGKAWSQEYRIQRRDGSYAHLLDRGSIQRDTSGRAMRMVGAMMDVSVRKEAEDALRHSEEQLRQAMKMEAVGRLAGGVAHDFNNLLTAVLGHADLVLAQTDADHPFREDVQEIKSAALRAAALTQQLLAFSRKQVLERRVVDLNQIVAGITRMLDRTIGEDIELVTDLTPHLGRVHADAVQLEQVLLNLAVNARDAMPEGGRLTIETTNVQLESGLAVRIRVADTGIGMAPEVLAHIFEPFFTTKELGKGTGLGLATVYGIVKQSGGHISVSSSRGHGTTFLIDFPRASEEPSRVEPAAATVERRSSGTETILLVEDEEVVRSLARRVLAQRGYQVIAASNAEEALKLSRGHAERIDLLLTDVVMPGVSGPKLAETLLKERRLMSVVYMSGYAATAVEQRLLLDESAPFIQKPFTPDLLARRVREVLDSAQQSREAQGVLSRGP